jgi:hypothetical protein
MEQADAYDYNFVRLIRQKPVEIRKRNTKNRQYSSEYELESSLDQDLYMYVYVYTRRR